MRHFLGAYFKIIKYIFQETYQNLLFLAFRKRKLTYGGYPENFDWELKCLLLALGFYTNINRLLK